MTVHPSHALEHPLLLPPAATTSTACPPPPHLDQLARKLPPAHRPVNPVDSHTSARILMGKSTAFAATSPSDSFRVSVTRHEMTTLVTRPNLQHPHTTPGPISETPETQLDKQFCGAEATPTSRWLTSALSRSRSVAILVRPHPHRLQSRRTPLPDRSVSLSFSHTRTTRELTVPPAFSLQSMPSRPSPRPDTLRSPSAVLASRLSSLRRKSPCVHPIHPRKRGGGCQVVRFFFFWSLTRQSFGKPVTGQAARPDFDHPHLFHHSFHRLRHDGTDRYVRPGVPRRNSS